MRTDLNRSGRLRPVAATWLLAALALGPLDFASTRPLPLALLTALVAAASAAWIALRPRAALAGASVAMRVGALLVGLSAAAWAFVLERPRVPAFTAGHLERLIERWPDSIVPRSFVTVLIAGVVAVAALFAYTDLFRDPAWRRAGAWVLLATGAAVALLGLVQNATHAAGIYWDASHRMPGAFFATFFHHTSAGAYLNTVWPVGLALTLTGVDRAHRQSRLSGATLAALGGTALVFAAHAGHVSRFPQVIAAIALAAFVGWTGALRSLARRGSWRLALIAGGVGAAALAFATVGGTRVHDISSRWHLLTWHGLRGGEAPVAAVPEAEWPRAMRDDLFVPADHRQYVLGDRGAAYATALRAIAARPWFGWGPGGWIAAAAANTSDPFVRTFFLFVQFTHEDFLQTVVEWGAVGALGWCLLIPGGLLHAVRLLGRNPGRDLIGAGAFVALAAVLVQSLIDFPLQIPAVQLNAVTLAAFAWSVPAPAHT